MNYRVEKKLFFIIQLRVIGQKVLIKTAVAIEISMVMAVLSCF